MLADVMVSMYTAAVEHAAVVDESGVLEGVVSSKDLGRAVIEFFDRVGSVERGRLTSFLEAHILEYASKPPKVARVGTGFREAAKIMYEEGIGFLPIVGDAGVFKGAYTELDAALALIGEDQVYASAYATKRVLAGDSDSLLIELLGLMVERGFRRIPLLESGRIQLLTLNDILYLVARDPDKLYSPAAKYAKPAIVVDAETVLGVVAELIIAVPERAVILDRRGIYGIITERDLLRAYIDLAGD